MNTRFDLRAAIINRALVQAHGLSPSEVTPRLRGIHRALVGGVYRGRRKRLNAFRRFLRELRRIAMEKLS